MSRFELETFIPGREDQFRSLLASAFIGCEEELGKLKSFLDDAMAGSGHFIVISGEAGTGKTRLAHQFLLTTEREGIVALEEKFDAESRYNPYAIFFRLLEHLAQQKMNDTASIQAQLAKLMQPENGNGSKKKVTSNFSSLYSLQTQSGLVQQKLIASLLEYAKDDTLILVLADLHLAPLTTWQFIHYLSKSLVEQKILILVSLRQDGREVTQQKIPPYADVLQRMNRERLVDRIGLQRFDLRKTREFLNTVFQRSDFSSKFIPWLYEVSGGIQGTLVAGLQALYDQGIIYKQNGVWFNQENLKREDLTRLVLGEINTKDILLTLKNLPERQQKMIEYGALLNDSFDYFLIGRILGISRIQVVKELVQLKDKKIVIESEDQNYKFKNSSIVAAILDNIPEEQIPVMHHNITQAIEKSDRMETPKKEYLMAYHCIRSTKREKALPHLLKAFDVAIANLAFIEAKEFYLDAMSLIKEGVNSYDPSDLLYLYFKMTWLSRVLGNYREGIEYAELGLKLSEELKDEEMRNQILIQKGLTYFRLNQWQESRDCFNRCLLAEVSDNGFIQAMANFGLGNVCLELSEYPRAVQYYQTALQLARQLDAEPLIGTLYNNLGIIENILGNHVKSIQMYSKSIPIYEKIGDHYGLARIYHNIGMNYADGNSWKKANEFYSRSLSVSDVMGLVPLKSITFLNRAIALIHLNRYEEAREYNFKAFRLLMRLNDELGISEYHKVQGILEREEKNWSEAVKHFDIAIEKFQALQNKLGVAETKYEYALMEIKTGNRKNAIIWLEKAKKDFADQGLQGKVKFIDKKLDEIKKREVVMNGEEIYD